MRLLTHIQRSWMETVGFLEKSQQKSKSEPKLKTNPELERGF